MTVDGDDITADWTGTSPQVKAAINAPGPFIYSATYLALRCMVRAAIPNAEGYMRPIKVIAPPGSIVNPHLPAAANARGITGFRAADTVLGALAKAVPERVSGGRRGRRRQSQHRRPAQRRTLRFHRVVSRLLGRPSRPGRGRRTGQPGRQPVQPAHRVHRIGQSHRGGALRAGQGFRRTRQIPGRHGDHPRMAPARRRGGVHHPLRPPPPPALRPRRRQVGDAVVQHPQPGGRPAGSAGPAPARAPT